MQSPTVPKPKWFGIRGASSRKVAVSDGSFLAQNGTDFIVQQAGDNILAQGA